MFPLFFLAASNTQQAYLAASWILSIPSFPLTASLALLVSDCFSGCLKVMPLLYKPTEGHGRGHTPPGKGLYTFYMSPNIDNQTWVEADGNSEMSSRLRNRHLSALDRGLQENLFVTTRCSKSLLFLRGVCPWKPNGALFVCWLLTAQGCKNIFATIPSQLGEAKHIHATSAGTITGKKTPLHNN